MMFFSNEKNKPNLLNKFQNGVKLSIELKNSTKRLPIIIKLMTNENIDDVTDFIKNTFSENNPFMKKFNVSAEDYGKAIRPKIEKAFSEKLAILIINAENEEILGCSIAYSINSTFSISSDINPYLKHLGAYQKQIRENLSNVLINQNLISKNDDKLFEAVAGVNAKYINAGLGHILISTTFKYLAEERKISFIFAAYTNPISYYLSAKLDINPVPTTIGVFKYDSYTTDSGEQPFLAFKEDIKDLCLIFLLYGQLNQKFRLANSLQFEQDLLSMRELKNLLKEEATSNENSISFSKL